MQNKPLPNLKEQRDLCWQWLDITASLKDEEEFHIPMRHTSEKQTFLNLIKKELREYNEAIPSSIFRNITVRGTICHGIYYLVLKKNLMKGKGIIISREEKIRALAILPKMIYNRKRQITLMLEDGFSKEEIVNALGKRITAEERKLLE